MERIPRPRRLRLLEQSGQDLEEQSTKQGPREVLANQRNGRRQDEAPAGNWNGNGVCAVHGGNSGSWAGSRTDSNRRPVRSGRPNRLDGTLTVGVDAQNIGTHNSR